GAPGDHPEGQVAGAPRRELRPRHALARQRRSTPFDDAAGAPLPRRPRLRVQSPLRLSGSPAIPNDDGDTMLVILIITIIDGRVTCPLFVPGQGSGRRTGPPSA